jgi:NAD(P)-dependent dehydrogenase (short-subunit alcohol dehydrogenase family)
MKTFVITGAGTGIGRATAILLSSDNNVRLILVGRNKENLQSTLALCARPELHQLFPIDIRSADEWRTCFKGCNAGDLNISGIFANAGAGGENHYGEGDRWDEIISTNLTGTYVTVMEALPYLKNSTEKFRHVVMTSSCLARFGVPNYTAYCTSKAGLLGLTKSLAMEFSIDNILVNSICPGWVETDMARAGIQNLADRDNKPYEKAFDEQMSYVPLKRISKPGEIASLIKFLFSSDQTSITGQGIDINNGSFMI